MLRNKIKNAKKEALDELIQTIDKDPWGIPYRLVLKKLRRTSLSLTESLEDDVLNKVIRKLFPKDPFWNENTIYRNEQSDTDEIEWRREYDVSMSELCTAIKKGGNATKAGNDGIKSIFLKKIPEILITRLNAIYNMYIRQGIFPAPWKKAILVLVLVRVH